MMTREIVKKIIFKTKICLLLVTLFSLISCSEGLFSTPIGKIQDGPRDFDGKAVTVKGTVTDSANLLFMKYFVLKDGTGEIHVITERIIPRKGETVTVKGKVQEAFSLGDQRLIVIVESTQ